MISFNPSNQKKRFVVPTSTQHQCIHRTYHIRIVPMSRSCQRHQLVLVVAVVVDDGQDAGPRVLNVDVVPPQVAGRRDGREVGL